MLRHPAAGAKIKTALNHFPQVCVVTLAGTCRCVFLIKSLRCKALDHFPQVGVVTPSGAYCYLFLIKSLRCEALTHLPQVALACTVAPMTRTAPCF